MVKWICFLSTYFHFDLFKSLSGCYNIRPELAHKFFVINCFSSIFGPILGIIREYVYYCIAFSIYICLDDAQDGAERTWRPIKYGKFIKQFRPDIITSIRQHEQIERKICSQKTSIVFNYYVLMKKCSPPHIYIYIYIQFSRLQL